MNMQGGDILICASCGNKVPHFLISSYQTKGTEEPTTEYYIMKCGTCESPSIYYTWELDLGADPVLLYPSPGLEEEYVPRLVRECRNEARSIMQRAPNAFAGQVGRTLETMCRDQKQTSGNLNTCIKELAQRGIIPPNLSEMMDSIRVLRNIGVHAGGEVSEVDTYLVSKFMDAILEYVYVAPRRIEELKARINSKKIV